MIAPLAEIGEKRDFLPAVKDMLDGNALLGLIVIEAFDVRCFAIAHHFPQGNGHRRWGDRFHHGSLFGRAILAHGLCGDLGVKVGHLLCQLCEQFPVETCIQNMFAVGIPHMGVNAIGTGLLAGDGRGDSLLNGDGQGGVIRLAFAGAIRGDHDRREWRCCGACCHGSTLSMAICNLPINSSICLSS